VSSVNVSKGLEKRISIVISGIVNLRLFKPVLFISIVILLSIGSSSAQNSFIILNSSNLSTMSQNIEYIESLGGNMTHRFPPHILIGDIPADKINELKGHGNIVDIVTKPLDVSVLRGYGKTAEIAVDIWNNNYHAPYAIKSLVLPVGSDPGPIIGDMLIAPKKPAILKAVGVTAQSGIPASEITVQTLPYGAGFYDTSEYMIGDIAVGIILLESNGSIDVSTEDWTTIEESNVVSEIQAGLNWWAVREPNAKLTFTYDIHTKVPTGYEPISHTGPTGNPSGESLWINDAMIYLGYSTSDYFDKVYAYENAIRQSNNTDWAFTIFVVDSANDPDGLFTDGYFAYAYLGGPFTVMTYDNDGYGIGNMDAVIAHETGHIFYANDQYAEAQRPCTEITGYLAIQNQNSAYTLSGPCSSNVDSIMRSQVPPYTNGSIDPYARQQIGWRDTDADGIMDIIDFVPVSILNTYSPDPTNDSTPTYTGRSSTTTTYPNNNPAPWNSGNSITINKIASIQYRVDNGSWINASPADGSFDSNTEDFNFTTPELSNGTHTFEVRALNTAGNWETSYASDILTLIVPDTTPPVIEVLSPQNRLYNKTIIPLNVSANEAISVWNYSLNGGINITFTPNTTITVSQVANNLRIYAMDLAGNWNSSVVDFYVDIIFPPGYINGTVLYNGTGISGAMVSTNTSVSTNTNETGFYSLLVPAGTYNITAINEPGYYANRSIVITAISGMTILQDIELIRKPTGTISGNVINIY